MFVRMLLGFALVLNVSVALWQSDLFSYSLLRVLPGGAESQFLFVPESSSLAVLTKGGDLTVYDVQAGTTRQVLRVDVAVTTLAASWDGRHAAYGTRSGEVGIVELSSGSHRSIRVDRGGITALAFSRASGILAAGTEKGKVELLSVTSGTGWTRSPGSLRGPVQYLAFRAHAVVAVSRAGEIREWDAQSGTALRQMQEPEGTILCAALSNSGKILAVGTEISRMAKGNPMRPAHPSDFFREQRIRVYDLQTGAVVKQITGIEGQVRSLSFSADGRFLAASHQNQTQAHTSVFDIVRGTAVASLPVRYDSTRADFSPNAKWLASTAPDGSIRILEVAGVQRNQSPDDLAGVRIRITSAETGPLLLFRQPTAVAVLDLAAAAGVEPTAAFAVSDMIRNRIAGQANVAIVEREKIQQILSEQNFQASDRVDASTAVSLGRIIGAAKIMVGSVSRLETSFSIVVRLVDVQTGRVDGVREVLCQRCSADDLPAAVAELRASLVPAAR